MTIMKRRTNFDGVKLRKSIRRSRLTEGISGSALMYLKFVLIWAIIMAADYLLEFRFEFLWPFWLVLRSIYDSFKYQGLLFSLLFVLIALITDLICYILLPIQWLFFAASSYVWIQYVWQTERGICLGTVILWVLLVWLEASVRLREIKTIDLCRPFAAHCIGYPMVTLGFGFKTYLAYKWRLRKQREVRKVNESYIQLVNQALPIEIQQEAEKERLVLEKGTFTETYDECSNPSTADGTSPTSPSSSSSPSNSSQINSNASSSNLINSHPQSNHQSTSLPCTALKRPQKLTTQDDSSTSNTFVQTGRQPTKISNGNDDEFASTYKQQKKQVTKSSVSQNRRQQKKPETKETTRAVSRDSSSSHQNGFAIGGSSDLNETDKTSQINKLESDLQRLNQVLERQRASEIQLRAQLSELKTVRKDLDDLRAENSALQTKFETINSQRQRDKQRLIDLERNLNEEKQQKQRLETQMKTEKSLTKKLQDDITKISSTLTRTECTEQCLKRKRDQENEIRDMRKLINDKDERIKILDSETKTLLKYRESQADTEVLYQHLAQIRERNAHLQDNLSAETRIKLDLFSALGEVKRQLEIANNTIREKERELAAALQSQQQQVNNCMFNGHRQSSGHSSPTNQLIDTNNNNPRTSPATMFYSSPTTITPPPPSASSSLPLSNAASNLDPNAQDFCLTNNNN